MNEAKKILAHEVTRLCHGLDTANSAAESARRTFEEGSIGRDLPFIKINKNDLEEGVWVIEAMRNLSLIKSNGEGRRLIANGGARVNDRVIKDPEKHLKTPDVSTEGIIKLSVGKKRHALLKVQ